MKFAATARVPQFLSRHVSQDQKWQDDCLVCYSNRLLEFFYGNAWSMVLGPQVSSALGPVSHVYRACRREKCKQSVRTCSVYTSFCFSSKFWPMLLRFQFAKNAKEPPNGYVEKINLSSRVKYTFRKTSLMSMKNFFLKWRWQWCRLKSEQGPS